MRAPKASTVAVLTALVASATTTGILISGAVPSSSSTGADEERRDDPAVSVPAPGTASGYRLVGVRGSNVRIMSRDCRDVEVRVRYVNPSDSDHGLTAEIDVWKGRGYQDQAFLYATAGEATDPTMGARGRYLWCLDQGIGDFRLGPTKVVGNSYSGDTDDVTFEDPTIGHFSVRRDSRTSLSVSRPSATPGRVRLTAAVANYTLRTGSYQRWPGRVVRIQRRDADGWTVVGFARADRRGVASTTLAARGGALYRARTFGTRYVWGSYSRSRVVPRS
jgi:hypothetical protein